MTDVNQAADRLEAFLARLDRLALEDLRLVALPPPDPEERAAMLEVVRGAATEAGRTPLVEEARSRAREAVMIAYNRHQYDPTWAGLNWVDRSARPGIGSVSSLPQRMPRWPL